MYSQDPRHPRPNYNAPLPPPPPPPNPSSNLSNPPQLRRGKSILARGEPSDDPSSESGLSLFKRGNTLRRKNAPPGGLGRTRSQRRQAGEREGSAGGGEEGEQKGFWSRIAPGPVDGWMIYCWILTCLVPGFVLRGVFGAFFVPSLSLRQHVPSPPLLLPLFARLTLVSTPLFWALTKLDFRSGFWLESGKRTPESQRAWREKMGLLLIIVLLMACTSPPPSHPVFQGRMRRGS